ncbi:MAG: flippase-like domain-containing protein [Acidobacteria bacterium]|nr:flippase-like domain-containing protein [Acidobacteriota bacterium]
MSRRKEILVLVLKGLVSGSLLALLAWRVDWNALRADLARTRVGLVAAAILVYALGQVISALRWKLLLDPLGTRIGLRRITGVYFLGMFFNLFLPTMIGGDAVKLYYVSPETGGVTRGAVSILMDRNVGLITLLLLACGATTAFDLQLPEAPLLPTLTFLLAGTLFANLLLFHERTLAWLRNLLARWNLTKLETAVGGAHEALTVYRRRPGSVAAAIGLSLLFDAALMFFNYLNAVAIGHPVSLKYFFAFVPIVSIVSMLPVTLYGLGIREYSVVYLFGQVGLPRESALLLSLLALVVPAIVSLPGGIVYLFLKRSEVRG